MRKNKKFLTGMFYLSMALAGLSILKFGEATKSSASIVKNYTETATQSDLKDVIYNGEKMFVAKADFFDYYSDSQVGESATPGEITDAKKDSLNTFSKFNTRLLEIKQYGDKAKNPAKYPMYQGKQYKEYSDMAHIYSYSDNSINEKSNYWVAANYNQIGNYATLGLVDNKLKYDASGTSYLTHSNPENGKSDYVPFFDKKFLTSNKHTGSELTLGSVKESVSFPFRKEVKDGVTYYEFDSSIDTVRFNADNQLDYLGKNNKDEQVKDVYKNPGFFPTNVKDDGNTDKLNFGFGMKIEVPFHMTSDGKINGKDISFEFSGDDDVWVFIDGVLALDIGGAHPKVSGSINFAEKKVYVSGIKNNQVAFATRTMNNYGTGKINKPELGLNNLPAVYNNFTDNLNVEVLNSLKDTSKVHTLTMFYMERGKSESNMKLKFNLPEPNKFSVSNKIDTETIGETFKSETEKVALKDNFLYDVVDKTSLKKTEIELGNKENVTFIEEFKKDNLLLVQEKALKISTRKLTDIYETSWILKDEEKEISKGKSLVVDDSRTPDKTIIFKNTTDKETPIVDVTYTNKPYTGTFTIVCDVTDKYKEKNTDYKEKTFDYTVSYENVFGGDLKETKYEGKYIVYNTEDDDSEGKECTAKDGIISLKYGQKACIKLVPVMTKIYATYKLGKNEILQTLKTTSNFVYDKENKKAFGEISKVANILSYIIGVKDETAKEPENLSNKDIEDITGEELPAATEEEKLESVEIPDKLDTTPGTGDKAQTRLWLGMISLSLLLMIVSGIVMFRGNRI